MILNGKKLKRFYH